MGAPATAPARGRKRKLPPSYTEPPSSSSSSSRAKKPSSSGGAASSSKAPEEATSKPKPKKPKIKPGDTEDEKRLSRFRPKPPQAFYDVYERATTQRFFVLSRTRSGTPDCPEEVVELTGSTGNVYTVTVSRRPRCDCPHGQKGNQCKHQLYVMSRVLRARFDLVYQLALLSSELVEILSLAPPIPSPASLSPSSSSDEREKDKDTNRKPVEGDCPICFEEFVVVGAGAGAGQKDGNGGGKEKGEGEEEILWCRAACGQNMHRQCLMMWSATKQQGKATCPLCRSPWQGGGGEEDAVSAALEKVDRSGPVNEEGYVNVADQLGISTARDHSSYSTWMGSYRYGRHRGRRW